ncbi:MAG: ABC transporter permease [Gemmatimonadaceae bacterium]|jgi:cell division transport system permease protein|nr:ABC transporter permease [Gemmatimonadaceae bacterium]
MRLALREAMLGFRRAPLLSVLGIVTIAFSLFSVGVFALVALNVRDAIRAIEDRVEIRAYLTAGTEDDQVAIAVSDLESQPGVAKATYVSPDQALERAKKEFVAFGDEFEDAVLPGSIELRLKEGFRDPQAVDKVATLLKAYPFIDDVRYGREWIEKIYRLRSVAAAVGGGLGVVFALAAVIIIGATIRMEVLARAREIKIMQLVGATDGFIRSPFLIEGCLKGLAGGVLALLLAYVAQVIVSGALGYADVRFFAPWQALLGVVAGAVIGVLGSLMSVGRHLRQV